MRNEKGQFVANGKVLGYTSSKVPLLVHKHFREVGIRHEFIHTHSFSGAIIELKNGNIVLGTANYLNAGKGYVFSNIASLVGEVKKVDKFYAEQIYNI